eukprot:m.250984 g.250984  ORF g.250984 m.250984 type:complete len:53 (+) comp17181_c8_seq4:846-1004(+)
MSTESPPTARVWRCDVVALKKAGKLVHCQRHALASAVAVHVEAPSALLDGVE